MKIEDTGDSMTVEESPILAETPGYDDKAIETNEESAQTIKNEESSIENPPASMFDASILGDRDKDEIYANSSDSLSTALINIRDGGVIYLEDSKYSRAFDSNVKIYCPNYTGGYISPIKQICNKSEAVKQYMRVENEMRKFLS